VQPNTTYVFRVLGWANGPTDFQIESTKLKGGAPPVVQAFASDFTLGGQRYDFDGNVTLAWAPQGAVEAYEIEKSTDGVNYSVYGTAGGDSSGVDIAGLPDGTHSFRVRAITAGLVGKYVTDPSNAEAVTVAQRVEMGLGQRGDGRLAQRPQRDVLVVRGVPAGGVRRPAEQLAAQRARRRQQRPDVQVVVRAQPAVGVPDEHHVPAVPAVVFGCHAGASSHAARNQTQRVGALSRTGRG
jgi:hypothetical protein